MVLTGSDTCTRRAKRSRGRRIKVVNNLFEDVDGGSGERRDIFEGGSKRVVRDDRAQHILHSGSISKSWGDPMPGYVFRNNLMAHNQYGIFGDSVGSGSPTLSKYFPGYVFAKNVIAGANPNNYPAGNFYPAQLDDARFIDRAGGGYRLSPTSPYKGAATDGKDIGCDFDALEAAMNSSDPTPDPTPTPSPSPSPSPTPTIGTLPSAWSIGHRVVNRLAMRVMPQGLEHLRSTAPDQTSGALPMAFITLTKH